MIVLEKYRIAILCVVKNGTTVLRDVFGNDARDFQHHWNIPQFKENNPELANEIDSYELYGFYRNPVERFISFINYNIRKYPELITPEVLEAGLYHGFVQEHGNILPQCHWLDYPNVQLLDFRNFDSLVMDLAKKCNLTVTEVPKLNVSSGGLIAAELSAEDRDFIKSCCARDYEFFNSRGISLD